jgi:chromosomal replication initiation ATPase DnaA
MKTTEIIKELILEETGIDIADKLRTRTNVEFRSMYFNIIKNLEPKLSLREIGEAVNRDHATVIYGLNQYEIFIKYNKHLESVRNRVLLIYAKNHSRYGMISIDEEINLLEKRIVELQELKSLYEQLETTTNE